MRRSSAGARCVAGALLLLLAGQAAATPPVIVIDAGHGGSNLGAFAPALGRHEKGLTLELALATARELRRQLPGARVLLTRQRDEYLTLEQRVRLANRARAAAFVSLHFNASPTRSESGFECYVVSAEASDREAARIAAGENAEAKPTRSDAASAGSAASDVSAILSDLGQRANRPAAWQLAHRLRQALARARPRAKDRGVRPAGFDVLLGLRMPGVLVELGFIDHPVEGIELGRATTQQALAAALAAGLASYLGGEPSPQPAAARGRTKARGS